MAAPKLPDYRAMAAATAARHAIPNWLFQGQIGAESGWDPNARSPVGAQGLGQLMPATARGLGVTDPSDPAQNLEGAAKYLQQMYDRFGRWDLALAAYNAGPGAVQQAGNKVPNIGETQDYVQKIMAQRPQGGGAPQAGGGVPSASASDTGASPPAVSAGMSLQQLLNFSSPSATSVGILANLGGTASKVAQRAQAEIPLPQRDQSVQQPTSGSSPASDGQQDPYSIPMIPLKGGLIDGSQKMSPGVPGLRDRYPNIIAQPQVDWVHTNNRLLKVVSDVAKKELGPTAVVTMTSGYRSNDYSAAHGGFAGDPHTRAIAGDFYVDGHPIGDVIPPEVWAKHGVRSGNTPGFYKGTPDSEHLDLIGMPLKGGNKRV